VGLLATIAHFVAAPSKRWGLLWFGLFAGPYGMALIVRSVLSPIEGSQPETLLVIFGKSVGLLAAIPALLLFQEWYGNGWHMASRFLIAVYTTAVILVLGLMAFQDRPKSIPSPGILLVILFPLFLLLDRITGYRSPPAPHRSIIFGGLLAFFVSFSYDHLAHRLSGNEIATTEPIGFMVLAICFGIVVAKQVATNERERIAMEDEMAAAREIQARILPAIVPSVPGLSIAVRYSPMTAVAGDFYAFLETGVPRIGITLADVMGHGVPAALVASMVKVSVTSSVERDADPPTVLKELNTTLFREAPGQYTTAVYISIDHDAGYGKYSSAGHPPPLLWRSAPRLLDKLNGNGLLLGVRKEEEYAANEFTFRRGDRLLIYSDGLTEAESEAGACFGDVRLPALIRAKEKLSAEDFATTLLGEVHAWCHKGDTSSQSDDITFVVVDFR
jgi:sigma-B regulation protein RsbU (phosphoserine phosphatase)